MNSMKRVFVALALMFALSAVTVLSACSSEESVEEAIRTDIAAQLDPFKNLDQAAMDELVESIKDAGLEDYGISSEDFVTSMFNGFDYSIDSVTIADDGNSASASVSVTCKTFSDASSRAEEMANEFVNSGEAANMTESELNARLGEIMMQAVDGAEAKTTTCEFGYTKSDEGWTINDNAESEIYNAFFA